MKSQLLHLLQIHPTKIPTNTSLISTLSYRGLTMASHRAIATLLSLLLSVSTFLIIQAQTQTPEDEKQILLQMKRVWGNPDVLVSWSNSGNGPHCSWPGIGCSGDGFVTNVTLYNQNISSPAFPSSICNLSRLSYLDLSSNYFSAPFPTSLYNCSNLQHLDLSQNYFVGVLPPDIDNLSKNLNHFDLSSNNFTGDIPDSIGKLTNLTSLYLHYNIFNGSVSPALGDLSKLEYLMLANNPFTPSPIPGKFGGLKSLTYLWMRQCNLIGELPGSVASLPELQWLDLSMNSLNGRIPSEIWMNKNLQNLYLFKNNFSGEINGTIGALSLIEIDVSMNQLTGSIPSAIGDLKNLDKLLLYNNNLSGQIPSELAKLPNIYDIRLFNNQLTGPLPADLGKNSPLWNIEVDNNQISGDLPQGLCAGKALESLVVFKNNFTGAIPASLGDCPTLANLQIYENNFSGELPAGIWSATNLTFVMVNGNSLSGELPDKLPWNLTRLHIENNRFSGDVPLYGGSLIVLKASNNNFSGELVSLSGLSKLQVLELDGNDIAGEIPADVAALRSLTYLNLSNNNIEGDIPGAIGSLPVLTTLDLSNNQLIGEIPSEIGTQFNFLNLSSNQLSGKIPYQLQSQVYDRSFLSNPHLCSSSNVLINVSNCEQGSRKSTGVSRRARNAFLIAGAALFLIAAAFAAIVVRDYNRKKKRDAVAASWKLTSFQAVEFNESSIIDGIREENFIGSGGSGKVYRISGGYRGGAVAVKRVPGGAKIDPKLEREFESEVKILGAVKHNNIVKLLCYIACDDCKLLVYEYMSNGSLDQWLHGPKRSGGHKLDWPTRLNIAIGAARGLTYMHHDFLPPIIHRDVKCSNILLDSEFRAKIADFGLARMLAKAGEPEIFTVNVAGSFGYMPPECAYSRKVNEKVDVYSFGVVLLELVTGRAASDGGGHGGLAESAWRHVRDGNKLYDVLDKDIKDISNQDEMAKVFKLGLICTGTLPSTRPTMKEALQILLSCDQSLTEFKNKHFGSERDIVPLLQTPKYSKKNRQSDSEEDNDTESMV